MSVHVPTKDWANISRPWNNTHLGDVTMNLDATSFMIHDDDKSSPRISTEKLLSPSKMRRSKSPLIEIKAPSPGLKTIDSRSLTNDFWGERTPTPGVWFNQVQVRASPYTFLTALNKKLQATMKETPEKKSEEKVEERPPLEPQKVLPPGVNFNRPTIVETVATDSRGIYYVT